ncbi:hypothetical protein ABIA35_004515 [Catenulispora sp. MAP12-49]|uniref:hypothetical protein n=1 Tax=unclassified Catenulispora TaxID=414885 RepID=UPI0035128D6F
MTNEFDVHTATEADQELGEGTAARPRDVSLLDDQQRAAFLGEWQSVQTGFATSPQQAVEAAERLVAALAENVARVVAEIADSVRRPAADQIPDEETWRAQLLRCREAFHLLIDS